jgi:hypothetical protein
MEQLKELLNSEDNRKNIAELIYRRYYDRYLKIFFFQDSERKQYILKDKFGNSQNVTNSIFNMEYKNGFSIMANCCLLIETLSSFFDGINETPNRKGKDSFKKFFAQSRKYNNELKVFESLTDFYYAIRCGLLHQGETKKSFKIKRNGELFEKATLTINATKFCEYLNEFLLSYKEDLSKSEKWDGDIWDKCRLKLRYIINNC